MSDGDPSTPPDGHEEIMEATYRALQEHGFADLTMQDIADEAGKSKSLLHYHYDTKQDLLVAFLDYLIERGAERAAEHADDPPGERLRNFAARALVDNDNEDWSFATAILELQAQAPHNETYRDQLAANEAALRDHLADIVREGVQSGAFRDVDPVATARLVLVAVDGARTHRVVYEDDTPEVVHDALVEQVIDPLEASDSAGSDADSGGAE